MTDRQERKAEGDAARDDGPDSKAARETQGLCANCSRRDRCDLPVPEGGVWRCEAYEEAR